VEKGASHLHGTSISLASKSTPWKWGQVEQEALKPSKVISKEANLSDFSKPFHVYTDSVITSLEQ
jgi:hypothetical protein